MESVPPPRDWANELMHPSSTMPKPHITIRDAVHLDIGFSRVEAQVIDTPQVQRLRSVKQLGFGYLVYPSAMHTRFEHSLGTCHLVGLLMERITQHTGHIFSDDERAIARAFALVHDASHIPFGHTLEDEHNLFARHDKSKRLTQIVDQLELRSALGNLYEPVRAIVEYASHSNPAYNKVIHSLVPPYLADLVAGTIGADLLDYLRRDNLFTGLRREYDPRVLDYFVIYDGQLVVNLTKHALVRIDTVSDIMDLLRMRYTLTEKVYYHHTKLAFGAVLAKAVRMAMEINLLNEEMIAQMGDWDLLHYLKADPKLPEVIRTLAKRITPREIYHRAYVLPKSSFGVADDEYNDFVDMYRDPKAATRLEDSIAEAAGVPSEDIVVYCPSRQMQLKEAKVPAFADDKVLPLIDWRSITPLEAPFYYEKFRQLWTFYVFAYGDRKTADRVGNATAEILGRPNRYDSIRI
jgi:uncharacterized protein